MTLCGKPVYLWSAQCFLSHTSFTCTLTAKPMCFKKTWKMLKEMTAMNDKAAFTKYKPSR